MVYHTRFCSVPFRIVLVACVAIGISAPVKSANWYVDQNASGIASGRTWGDAWNRFSQINWTSVQPGDTLFISGGTNGARYRESLVVGKSGTSNAAVTIRVGQEPA